MKKKKKAGIIAEKEKKGTNKDRQTKIVHVKQNKHSLCGKIPAGLLPPPQLVAVDPRRETLLGFLKHDSEGSKQNTERQESQSTKQIIPQLLHNLFKRLTNKVRRILHKCQSLSSPC